MKIVELFKNRVIKILLAVMGISIILDQLSKIIISRYLNENLNFGFFALEKVTNEGMALGFNSGNVKNIFMMIFVIAIIINFIIKQIDQIDTKTGIVLGFILGGGISNLIDRFFRHGVLDFIRFGKFFTCNLADVFVFVGWVLLVLHIVLFSNKNNKTEEQKSEG